MSKGWPKNFGKKFWGLNMPLTRSNLEKPDGELSSGLGADDRVGLPHVGKKGELPVPRAPHPRAPAELVPASEDLLAVLPRRPPLRRLRRPAPICGYVGLGI